MSLTSYNLMTKYATVGVCALVLVTGCSYKQYTFCEDQTLPCEPPSPPPFTESKPAKAEDVIINNEIEKTVVPSDFSDTNTDTKKPVKVIAQIRNHDAHKVVFTKRTNQRSIGTRKYTIQLGAYKLEASRQSVIKRFTDTTKLNLFSMSNGFLGLSYGQYSSKDEALKMTKHLKQQGFNDLLVRIMP